MATVREIYDRIDTLWPFATQMGFDNAGFLVGRGDREVKKILLSLDITPAVAKEAAEIGAELIVSHHPVIFFPAKTVNDAEPVGQTLLELIENCIAAICVHTNLDKAPGGVSDALAEALGLENIGYLEVVEQLESGNYGIGRYGELKDEMELETFCAMAKKALGSNGLRYAGCGKKVKKVAVGGGACHEFVKNALDCGCDTFLTSDLKYNDFLDAPDLGINIIDAGHYPTENVVMPVIEKALGEDFPEIKLFMSRHSEVINYV
ncbi:MAG: Nif3-like dinuclear metal center hexameric protein [Oscillospiraceae bacterium]|nr:Nif3-like dinuclear metal center hexameric protein [Oscillospiraceae bacterium]